MVLWTGPHACGLPGISRPHYHNETTLCSPSKRSEISTLTNSQSVTERGVYKSAYLLPVLSMRLFSGIPALERRCHSLHESNIGPIEPPHHSDIRLYSYMLPRCGAPTTTPAVYCLCYRWADIVNTYSVRALTDPHDKLPAIGGIAQRFQYRIGINLLRRPLGQVAPQAIALAIVGLSWTPCCRTPRYRAPSWSWASMDGSIELEPAPHSTTPPILTIIGCDVTVKGLLKTALVRDNELLGVGTGQRVSSARLDTQPPPVSVLTWCLPITSGNGEHWEVETMTSDTSEDYPDSLCAFLGSRRDEDISKDWYSRRMVANIFTMV